MIRNIILNKKFFYRYERKWNTTPTEVECRVFEDVKETPCGYWIKEGGIYNHFLNKKIWVSKTARKRFAYPTKEEAMTNFIKRTEKHIRILKNRLYDAEESLKYVNHETKRSKFEEKRAY